ncbi:MAG: methylmalonyl Co-A mutase-associated GTPase MeaB [Pirellulales bacterium]|nr:methylmalonyl Co-A mutase-associated GTPase MeaB [Planctomycetales bacterium]
MKRKSGRRPALSLDDYYVGVRARDMAIFPRALTLIESNHPDHQQLAEALLTRVLPDTGQAIRIGITGPPGVGKSTTIESLGLHLVRNGRHVAVLAVDPSSGVSGGSILGDKTRMARLSAEPNAFIRPSPSAGTLGGVARKTREAMLICEAAGFDVVLIETVGVGQSETMVADMTDCFLALMLPGAGDELQGIKRGLLELVDVIAVNKADGDAAAAAELAARQYRSALASIAGHHETPPAVLTCSALYDHNIDQLWTAVADRYEQLKTSGELAKRHRRQRAHWLWTILDDQIHRAIREHPAVCAIRDDLEQRVLAGTLPPEVAARQILEALQQPVTS